MSKAQTILIKSAISDFNWHDVVAPTHPEHKQFQEEFARIKTTDNFVEYATLE